MRILIRYTAFVLARDTKEIYEFAICGLIITNSHICDLRTGTPQKFADLRLPNELQNLRICGLRTNSKICVPTFAYDQ